MNHFNTNFHSFLMYKKTWIQINIIVKLVKKKKKNNNK